MLCPECNIEARITKVKKVFKTSEQKMFRYITYSCENKKCPNFKQEVGTVESEDESIIIE